MNPETIKILHVSSVALSYGLFTLRGIWRMYTPEYLQRRWVKILPHIVDSILLISAITLAVMLNLSPTAAPWLLAKIIALLLYIVLGTIALKRGKTKTVRLGAWLMAQAVFFYIVATAITHDPLPWRSM